MILSFMRRDQPPRIGWFGKLPEVGDFAGRGLSLELRERIHQWCAEGLTKLAQVHGEHWREAYQLAPVWHFAMNARVWDERGLIGCIAPSRDRVGRCSPLIALRTLNGDSLSQELPPTNMWVHRVDDLLRGAISGEVAMDSMMSELERAHSETSGGKASREAGSAGGILSDLGIGDAVDLASWFSWPDLDQQFQARRMRSFWWAEPSPKLPPKQVIHTGLPDADLFELLMNGWVDR